MLVSKYAQTPLSFLPRLEETYLEIKHVKKASNLKVNRLKHNDVCKFPYWF